MLVSYILTYGKQLDAHVHMMSKYVFSMCSLDVVDGALLGRGNATIRSIRRSMTNKGEGEIVDGII